MSVRNGLFRVIITKVDALSKDNDGHGLSLPASSLCT